jgi:excisionase family DNA binding protein
VTDGPELDPHTEEASMRNRTSTNAAVEPAVPTLGHQGHQLVPQERAAQRLLLTVSEAAHRLGIGRSLLYELLADGQVESIHVGRLRRIPTDALATYIDQMREERAASAD